VIVNGVDTTQFRPADAAERREARQRIATDWSQCKIIGHVARLTEIKNQSLLLRSFRGVIDRDPDVRLLIAGSGPLASILEDQVGVLGLRDHVRFVGELKDIAGFLHALDLFALSSDAEGMPMSVLEAMASRVCVVSTSVGGIPDMLNEGRAGVLVPPNNQAAFVSALLSVLGDATKRSTLAHAAYERSVTLYSQNAMVDRYEALYAEGSQNLGPENWFGDGRAELSPRGNLISASTE
jgi:glycosyltransferase involved in cell wall biosynthesis